MNSIQLEYDKEVLEFMEKSGCIYGFPLPAVDSEFVRRPEASENVDEVLKIIIKSTMLFLSLVDSSFTFAVLRILLMKF